MIMRVITMLANIDVFSECLLRAKPFYRYVRAGRGSDLSKVTQLANDK